MLFDLFFKIECHNALRTHPDRVSGCLGRSCVSLAAWSFLLTSRHRSSFQHLILLLLLLLLITAVNLIICFLISSSFNFTARATRTAREVEGATDEEADNEVNS